MNMPDHGDVMSHAARSHLNGSGGMEYLNAINGTSPEAIQETRDKLSPLFGAFPDAQTILSVGVGNGAEPIALEWLFKDSPQRNIIGVDISRLALRASSDMTERFGYPVRYTEAAGSDLPFADNSIDVLSYSAVLHEIFSYMPDGENALRSSLGEAARVLSDKGAILIRDFAHPNIGEDIILTPKHNRSIRFYEYFRNSWRQFYNWSEEHKEGFADTPKLPPLLEGSVVLHPVQAAEVVMHFRNFYNDWSKGVTDFDDQDWKELQEVYMPLIASDQEGELPGNAYMSELRHSLNYGLGQAGGSIAVQTEALSSRPSTAKFVEEYFDISGSQTGRSIGASPLTNKYELLACRIVADNSRVAI